MTRHIANAETPVGLLDGVLRGPDWTGAACVDHDPEVWFPGQGDYVTGAVAKAICETCPVRQRCLDWALDHPSEHGIWGGAGEKDRERMRRDRRRGR